ncbi:MAG: hypothetical protein ACD_11C00012G0001 [uncultured bacterium]|nr:MAG: hypothetical protein ACD_11C00012G0001 [uncultured bacterium]HBR71684.1 hypothetical protein [Candidatus Moranbacteria bacterium]
MKGSIKAGKLIIGQRFKTDNCPLGYAFVTLPKEEDDTCPNEVRGHEVFANIVGGPWNYTSSVRSFGIEDEVYPCYE